MAKESFYFSHDFGSRNDPKIQKVLMKLGQAGKGVYWDLIEMIYEEGGYLNLDETESYAFALRTDNDCITKLINDFGLFEKDSTRFWSLSALRRIERRNEKSEKARSSAQNRWKNANASDKNANALRTESECNAIKERKGNNKESINIVGLPTSTPTTSTSFEDRCNKFISKFNEIKNSKYKPTKKVKSALKERLKKYPPAKILEALQTALKDPKHIQENFMYVTPEFILREEILERYLNSTPPLEAVSINKVRTGNDYSNVSN